MNLCRSMPITRMQYPYNLPDIVPVHLFTASPLTSQQMVFIHPSAATKFAGTFFTNKVALPSVECIANKISTNCNFNCTSWSIDDTVI